MAPVTLKPKARPKSASKSSSSKSKRAKVPHLKSDEIKTKRSRATPKKKQRTYTEKELGIPKLNGIIPAGVQKPKGKKKGKVFVDDQQSTMTILAMVMAEKDGQIESKMMKARQLEEIRAARQKEAEARQEEKKAKLEETKDSLRKGRRRKLDKEAEEEARGNEEPVKAKSKSKKRVSFG
jgi:60S ribosomal subunit assembly/export protein LOC1